MNNDAMQGLTEKNETYCARVSDAVLRMMAQRWWLECDGDRLRAARAEARRRGITVA